MTNADLVRAYLAAFSSGNPDSVAAFVSDDFRNIQVGELGEGCTGASTYRARLVNFLGHFKNLSYTVQELVSADDKVAVTYTMQFTDNGRPVDIEGAMFMLLRDGKITERRDYWDGLSYEKQTQG